MGTALTERQDSVADGTTPDILRKPVNTLAIAPKSARITLLGRKTYNVLLYIAQEQGLHNQVFRAPLSRIIKGVDFDSNDTEVIKKHLRAMVSTTVEWQSPTAGEGAAWKVSGLLADAAITKQGGMLWVEWSYSQSLRKELLEPTVFARLKLEVISQLRSHASVALYEICSRYKDIFRTSRQPWRWWHPVLTGAPHSPSVDKLEYRFFKRDTLTPAIAEVNAITDLEIELIEHKQGRAIAEIQFGIRAKAHTSQHRRTPPDPVDISLVAKAIDAGIDAEKADELLVKVGPTRFAEGLRGLEDRIAKNFPGPVRDKARYFRALLEAASKPEDGEAPEPLAIEPHPLASAAEATRRTTKWRDEWLRRRREQMIAEISSLPEARQQELVRALQTEMAARGTHPSIVKRLTTSGWQHPMVVQEMVRHYATLTYGSDWDAASADEVLPIAAELGDG